MLSLPAHLQRDLLTTYLTTPERAALRWRGRVAKAWWVDDCVRPRDVWRARRALRAWRRATAEAARDRRGRRRRASWSRGVIFRWG